MSSNGSQSIVGPKNKETVVVLGAALTTILSEVSQPGIILVDADGKVIGVEYEIDSVVEPQPPSLRTGPPIDLEDD
jgi:hypothetical protein